MMNKGIKRLLVVSATVAVIGGICLGAGLAMGGSPSFYYDKAGIHVKENHTAGSAAKTDSAYVRKYTKTGAVKNLDIALQDAKLMLASGDDWAVEYVLDADRLEPEYRLENGTLIIRENENYKQDDRTLMMTFGDYWWSDGADASYDVPYVRVTIPRGAKLETADISSRYGDISVGTKLYAKQADFETQNGELILDGWQGEKITLSVQYGEVVCGKLEGKEVFADSENGSVKVDGLLADKAAFDIKYGDLRVAVERTDGMEVDSENGSVTLDLNDTMERYGVSLHTENGTIRTPQGIVETDEYGNGPDFICMDGDSAAIRVYTEYGDIKVRE